MNRENGSETCENGEQGVSFVGHGRVSTPRRNAVSDCNGIHTKAFLKPCNEHPPRKVSLT